MGKKEKIRNLNRTAENDIRYRGPLSYRHLLIMGWIGIVFMVIGIWTNLGITMDPNSPQWIVTLNRICSFVGAYALPLLLLSNFCIILDEKKTYSQLIKKNAGFTVVIVVVYMLVYGRYLSGIVNLFTNDPVKTKLIVTEIIKEGTRTGELAFNIFIDMLLCTLFMFFLNYVPKKGFFAKNLLSFRYLAVFPVLYEIASLVIRMLSATGRITPSFYIYPFLTTKAPLSFVMFVALSLYLKIRERGFLKNGKTLSDYKAFLKTNANSWQFSVYASLILVITCVIDLVLLVAFMTSITHQTLSYVYSSDVVDSSTLENEIYDSVIQKAEGSDNKKKEATSPDKAMDEALLYGIFSSAYDESESDPYSIDYADGILEEYAGDPTIFDMVKSTIITDAGNMTYAWGFGKHVQLIILLPFLLLLSYTRVYKSMKVDSLVPKVGAVLVVLVSLECLYQGVLMFAPSLIKMLS